MVFIADYGAGNLHSVQKAFSYLGVNTEVSNDPARLAGHRKVVVPGVGAFGPAATAFRNAGFDNAIKEHVDKGGHVLGICLGMQLFMTKSEEMGAHEGLDLVEGDVLRFDESLEKVPQIGWNTVDFAHDSELFKGVEDHSYFYFVHSYYCAPRCEEDILARTFFAGKNFCSAIEKNGIFAVQFHPEKSSEVGLQVLKNFAKC